VTSAAGSTDVEAQRRSVLRKVIGTLMPMIRGFCVARPAELIKTSECTPERAFGALDQASIALLPMITGFLRDLPAPGRTGDGRRRKIGDVA
jgi:hypothetical protein